MKTLILMIALTGLMVGCSSNVETRNYSPHNNATYGTGTVTATNRGTTFAGAGQQ